jgi:PilZ domain
MRWLARSKSHDRRNGERHCAPLLVAYYWNGANATPHGVRDMSTSGVYLVTEDRWYPGTLVLITLQKSAGDAEARRSIGVQSKVVRSGPDGVGFTFVFPTAHSVKSNAFIQGADRTAFIEFSTPFLSTETNALNRLRP